MAKYRRHFLKLLAGIAGLADAPDLTVIDRARLPADSEVGAVEFGERLECRVLAHLLLDVAMGPEGPQMLVGEGTTLAEYAFGERGAGLDGVNGLHVRAASSTLAFQQGDESSQLGRRKPGRRLVPECLETSGDPGIGAGPVVRH